MTYVPTTKRVKCTTPECENITSAGQCIACKSAKEKLTTNCLTDGCPNQVRKNKICAECANKLKKSLHKCGTATCDRTTRNEFCALCTNRNASVERRRVKEEAKVAPPNKKTTIEKMTQYLEKRGYSVEKIERIAELADNIAQ